MCMCVRVRACTHTYIQMEECNVYPKAISPKGVADTDEKIAPSRVLGGDTDAQASVEKVMLGREHEDPGTARASEHLGGFGLQWRFTNTVSVGNWLPNQLPSVAAG